jgi:hypothetical protein
LTRYFFISAILVLAVAIAATAYVQRDLIRIKIAAVNQPATPKPEGSSQSSATAAPFSGDAPWALSALPECFTQIEEDVGSLPYVRSHLPKGAVAIRPPATLVFGDCTIRVRALDAAVERGPDRFHIPPQASFYRSGDRLVLLHANGKRGELRIYKRSGLTSQ